MNLTIAYITARRDPKIEWFFDSLEKQHSKTDSPRIIVVAFHDPNLILGGTHLKVVKPKPTIWQGEHRITKEDWWAKSNALNTAISLCETDWIAFVDDRSVLMPGWLDRIKDAMKGRYAVCGRYEKRHNLKVEKGEIVDWGELSGTDTRRQMDLPQPTRDWYGGHGALKLEWCLRVNGFSEDLCDSLGSEDSMFGHNLYMSDIAIRYDSRMMIVEDRTPSEIDGALKRSDFGVSPNDKSHAIVERLRNSPTSQNSYSIRELRNRVLAGEPFPPSTASHIDWYDGADIPTKFNAL